MVPLFSIHQSKGAPVTIESFLQGITMYPALSSARRRDRAFATLSLFFARFLVLAVTWRVGSVSYTSLVRRPLVTNLSFFELLDEGMISRVDCTRSGLCCSWRAAKQTQALSLTYRPILCTSTYAHFHAPSSSTLARIASSFLAEKPRVLYRLSSCAFIANDCIHTAH